jgi:hypothetical protein
MRIPTRTTRNLGTGMARGMGRTNHRRR